MLLSEKILFTPEECLDIVNLFKINPQKWLFNGRSYNSLMINYSNETDWIFKKLKSFVEQETKLVIKKLKNEIHFHTFVVGDYFDKHTDLNNERIYAVGVLLNNDFKGGDFKLYNPDELKLNKEIGNTYIFDVNILHEITEVLVGTRYSLLWFLGDEHIQFKQDKLI